MNAKMLKKVRKLSRAIAATQGLPEKQLLAQRYDRPESGRKLGVTAVNSPRTSRGIYRGLKRAGSAPADL